MDSADDFLATGQKFQLGFLETEKPHPRTASLSMAAQDNLPRAIEMLTDIDVAALEKLKTHTDEILHLRSVIRDVWASDGRVFLCGCGATGRLSLTLEALYRQSVVKSDEVASSDKVIAFMAGGDVALVHSLEGFEDFPDYGERHLRQLGFGEKDLLISTTEGGETPYVIGATEAAAKISKVKPYFLYCNPDDLLARIERSKRVIENPKIAKINLTVGPMSLAGSTRMQASTVLQLAVGLALLTDFSFSPQQVVSFLTLLQKYLRENAAPFLKPFIEREAAEYAAERFVLYRVRDYSITVFTDTTERAPTFSLTPFSHRHAERLLKLKPSLCYVAVGLTKKPEDAWHALLGREPRSLNWLDRDDRTGDAYLKEFDFSEGTKTGGGAREFRRWLTKGAEHTDFEIFRHKDGLLWRFQDVEMSVIWPNMNDVTGHGSAQGAQLLFEHTLLKMFLNTHSTLIMGRLNRYKSNLMTWVYPTNGKLIDRASRYVQTLLSEEGVERSYDVIVRKLFELRASLSANESIVLATYNALKNQ